MKGCFNLVSLLKYGLHVVMEEMEIKFKLSPQLYTSQFQNRNILQIGFNTKSAQVALYNQLTNVIEQLNLRYQILGQELLKLYPCIRIQSLLQTNQKIASQYNYNFWNRLDISVTELFAYASHLDLLLLRSKNPVAYVSRFFMRSHYDHVALIIRSQLHQLFVFEAIESRGVCLIDLETFLKINEEDYEEIALRKLVVKQTREDQEEGLCKGINLERLEMYLNSLLGKKYQLSLSKLLLDDSEIYNSKESVRYASSTKDKIDKKFTQHIEVASIIDKLQQSQTFPKSQQKPQKTYFCSQLIADIYLKFGIIKEGKSKDFWPKDFQQNQIKLRDKACFSPLMNVCLK